MAEALGQKIQALIGYRTELANYIHFARLFQSQLIHVGGLTFLSYLGLLKLLVKVFYEYDSAVNDTFTIRY